MIVQMEPLDANLPSFEYEDVERMALFCARGLDSLPFCKLSFKDGRYMEVPLPSRYYGVGVHEPSGEEKS